MSPEERHPSAGRIAKLSEPDVLALEQSLPHLSQGLGAPSAADPQRAQRVAQLLGALDRYDCPPPSEDLVARTLARVNQPRLAVPMVDEDRPAALPIYGHVGQAMAVAAMIALMLSLVWPALAQMRSDARRVTCASYLQEAGHALGSYAADHAGMLPRLGSWPDQPWYKVQAHHKADAPVPSNSAHLYLLVRGHYLQANRLNCPDNPHAPGHMSAQRLDWPSYRAVSYSYQNQFTPEPIEAAAWPRLAVLADRNPLFSRSGDGKLRFARALAPDSPSFAHGAAGQNVLTADGAARWHARPVIGQDNIWLIRDRLDYRGNETPEQGDAFLVP